MHAGSCGEWKMADLQAVVSCHVGLGTELWSFTRAAWALTCGAFPPAPVPFTQKQHRLHRAWAASSVSVLVGHVALP